MLKKISIVKNLYKSLKLSYKTLGPGVSANARKRINGNHISLGVLITLIKRKDMTNKNQQTSPTPQIETQQPTNPQNTEEPTDPRKRMWEGESVTLALLYKHDRNKLYLFAQS